MRKYPYLIKTKTLREILKKIPEIGVPQKMTIKVLESLSFKSTNDRPVIKVLKDIGFLDGSGHPTPIYLEYRDKPKSDIILGRQVKQVYKELYMMHPEAHNKDDTTLHNFFATQSGLASQTVKAMVNTFKVLANLSSFRGEIQEETEEQDSNLKEAKKEEGILDIKNNSLLNLSLSEGRKAQISIPEDISSSELNKLIKLLEVFKD